MEHGVVLGGGGDEVIARLAGAEKGEIVGFGAARGEDELGGAAVEEPGELVSRMVDGGAGALTLLMGGTGIAEAFVEVRAHGLENLGQERGRGVGIEIDARGCVLHDRSTQFCHSRAAIDWTSSATLKSLRKAEEKVNEQTCGVRGSDSWICCRNPGGIGAGRGWGRVCGTCACA